MHLAKQLQFPKMPYLWDNEISTKMLLNKLCDFKIKKCNKKDCPPTKSEMLGWMRNIGNDEDDMRKVLKEARYEVLKGSEKGTETLQSATKNNMQDISNCLMFHVWMRYTFLFSEVYSYQKNWTEEQAKEIFEKSSTD